MKISVVFGRPAFMDGRYPKSSSHWTLTLYCWWLRNPARKPIERWGSLSHYLQGFDKHPNGGWEWDFWNHQLWDTLGYFGIHFGHFGHFGQVPPAKKTANSPKLTKKTSWWFQICFIFTPIWGRFPIWLIFFQMGWFNHQQKKSCFGLSAFIAFEIYKFNPAELKIWRR